MFPAFHPDPKYPVPFPVPRSSEQVEIVTDIRKAHYRMGGALSPRLVKVDYNNRVYGRIFKK
jgi:hypothetical protein